MMNRYSIWICYFVGLSLYANITFAENSPVTATIEKAKRMASPELLQEIDQIIQSNPNDPEINKLRLYRIKVVGGMSSGSKEETIRLIKDFDVLAQNVGIETEVGYESRRSAASLLYHAINDFETAFNYYKSLETHPSLNGDDLQTEYKKIDLYTRITEAAHSSHHMPDQVEKYAKLVMGYPYLLIKDSEMYSKFYQLYDDAANYFINEFKDDAKQLTSIEIYSSHPDLCAMRATYLKQVLVPENITEVEHPTPQKETFSRESTPVSQESKSKKTFRNWMVASISVILIILLLLLFTRKRKIEQG